MIIKGIQSKIKSLDFLLKKNCSSFLFPKIQESVHNKFSSVEVKKNKKKQMMDPDQDRWKIRIRK